MRIGVDRDVTEVKNMTNFLLKKMILRYVIDANSVKGQGY